MGVDSGDMGLDGGDLGLEGGDSGLEGGDMVAGGAISARQTTLILRESQLNTNRVGRCYGYPSGSVASEVHGPAGETSSGGAMHIKDSEVSVAQSTFKFNQAQESGGAVYVYASNVSLSDSHLSFNSVAWGDGGGIAAITCALILNNVTSCGNAAINGDGGAVTMITESVGAVTSSAFVNNTAEVAGGALNVQASQLELWGVEVSQNAAAQGGGIFANDATALAVLNGSVLVTNRALVRGGALKVDGSRVDLQNSTLYKNTASFSGGASFTGAAVFMREVAISHCEGEHYGGGLTAEDSVLILADVRLRHNAVVNSASSDCIKTEGGAMRLNRSMLKLTRVTFASNVAPRGGAIAADASNVTAESSAVEGNAAEVEGGGAWINLGSTLSLSGMRWVENEGERGGAFAVSFDAKEIRLEACNFTGNHARYGGAAYFMQLRVDLALELRSLHFVNNSALHGPNLFWEFSEEYNSSTGPACTDCVHDGQHGPLLSSSTKEYGILWSGGFLTKNESLPGQSGVVIDPAPAYCLRDFYGAVFLLEQQMFVVASSSTASASVGGQTIRPYTKRAAEFEDLVLSGPPGSACSLVFTPQDSSMEVVTVSVELSTCQAGEQYVQDSNVCVPCASGTVKWNNSSQACISCEGSGLLCLGGDQFAVQPGYWLAAGSARSCAADDPQCVLDRVHMCTPEEACPGNASSLHYDGDVAYIPEGIYCETGYRADTVVCGVCATGYERVTSGECHTCMISTELHWGLLAGALAVALVGGWAFYRWKMRGLSAPTFTKTNTTVWTNYLKAREDYRPQAFLAIAVGHIQVVSQQLLVYDAKYIPSLFRRMLAYPEVLNISLVRMLGLQCVVWGAEGGKSLSEHLGISSFHFNLVLTWLLPVFILLPSLYWLARAKLPVWTSWRPVAAEALPLVLRQTSVSPDTLQSEEEAVAEKRHQVNPLLMMGSEARLLQQPASLKRSSSLDPMTEVKPCDSSRWTELDWSDTSSMSTFLSPPGDAGFVSTSDAVDWDEASSTTARQSAAGVTCSPLGGIATSSAHQEISMPQRASRASTSFSTVLTGSSTDGAELIRRMNLEPAGRTRLCSSMQSDHPALEDSFVFRCYRAAAPFLLVYIHPMVSTLTFQVFDCEELYFNSESVSYFLRHDRATRCFTPEGYIYMFLATVVIALFVLGLPAGLAAMLWYFYQQKEVRIGDYDMYVRAAHLRVTTPDSSLPSSKNKCRFWLEDPASGELIPVQPYFIKGLAQDRIENIHSRIEDPRISKLLLPHVGPFRRRCFYWAPCGIVLRVLQTSVLILARMALDDYVIIYAAVVTCLSLVVHAYSHPMCTAQANILQIYSQGSHVITVLAYIAEAYINSDVGSEVTSIILICVQSTFCLVLGVSIVKEVLQYIRRNEFLHYLLSWTIP
eukprot:gene5365-6510_t